MSRKPFSKPSYLLDDSDASPDAPPLTDKEKQELVDKQQQEIMRANNEFVATIEPPNLSESDTDEFMDSDFND